MGKLSLVPKLLAASLLVLAALDLIEASAQSAGTFVIEAEDFDYDAGRHRPEADAMPYLGGAYSGLGAIHDIDYHRHYDEGSANEYRLGESPNVPMNGNADMDRGGWTVNVNYKIGWIGDVTWFDYTRDFPSGHYRVYAALSYGDTSPSSMRGSFQRVTAGAGTMNQTLEDMGRFEAAGSGGWGLNALVPMVDTAGKPVIVQMEGQQTLRFNASSGDVDYYKFVMAGPPQILQQPANTTVVENRPVTFTVVLGGEDPASFQWQSNSVDIAGATNSSCTFAPPLSAGGSLYRCLLSNALGSTNTTEATLTVTRDTEPPRLVKALNLGPTTVRLAFDEGVAVPAGEPGSSFTIDNGVTVLAAAAGALNNEILLTVSPLAFGTTRTVTVNNVQDLAAMPNVIAPNSTVSFVACEYAPADIGNPAQAGAVSRLDGGGFEVIGGGSDIGGTRDQFHFSWEQRTGDFDIQARVASVSVTDPFLHAGLMARDTLEPNARFAAVFASSVQLGCFFESRAQVGAATATAATPGGFPVNYPQTWLRLKRARTTLTGYASLDGQAWVQLGSATITGLPSTLYFGMAVASEDARLAAKVEFRDISATVNTGSVTYFAARETLGVSSRATGLVISEIMYNPRARADGRNLEFIEIYNARAVFEELSGWRIAGDIDYRFPDGFQLEAGEFVVIAASPDDVRAVCGIANVLGPYTGSLPNDTGRVRVRNNLDAVRLEVDYSSDPPWPAAADGAGHSLVLARPSYGENDVRAWAASELMGGSPGGPDAANANPWQNVLINEFLAHTDDPQLDFIELYNHSNQQVDISGCFLSDDAQTNKFRIPDGTVIQPAGFVAFDQDQLGFRLDSTGERIYLVDSNAVRVLDAIKFGPQENGVSSGRCPDGAPWIRRLASPTKGETNSGWRVEPVVINEIMYNPISGDTSDEYVELCNRGAETVDLSGWRFVDGIDYEFPANTTVAAGAYLVVAKDAARLWTNYVQLNITNTVGDFGGSLANGGERLALARPHEVLTTNEFGETLTNLMYVTVTEVTYGDGGRWGEWADGGGSSLELIHPDADPLRAPNWADSDETQKAGWTTVSFTGKLDNGHTDFQPNRLYVLMLGAGVCLVDDIEVFRTEGSNLVGNGGFENGTLPKATGWSFFGNHSQSKVEAVGAAGGDRCLRVIGQSDGDTGINSIRTVVASGLVLNNTGTIRAKVRWQAGWPEILFRLRGCWLELAASIPVPKNLGTPGLPNSRVVASAGPAIFDVTHTPALPRANQAVLVTCRVSDPDGIGNIRLRYRVDPASTLSNTVMRDDGAGGDEVAGDGIYSAKLTGKPGGTLIAFRIEATDLAALPATTVFPARAPAQECLVRWDDPIPFGTFPHYHLWNTQATENSRQAGLDNTYRDATLVYGNSRVIYNVGFRDKGSPWHGGYGDWTVTVPADDKLLGTRNRVLAGTGNAGSEATAIRSQLSGWLAQEMGIPYLHANYILMYRNGGPHREVMEDLEQPNRDYTRKWFPDTPDGDFYKVSIWYEFQDDNSSFGPVGATLESFKTSGGAYKLARYRWTFQRRPNDGTANNLTSIYDLVTAANDTSTNYVNKVLTVADLEEWMRVFAYHRCMGNWDSWSYSVGQNMFIYKEPGRPIVLLPWDIDFTFGLGEGSTGSMWGGQDPVINRMYDTPAFQRGLWRAFIDAVNGPMLPERYGPQVEARRAILRKNNIPGLSGPETIYSYVEARRGFLQSQINANDTSTFAITTNNGNDYNSTKPATVLAGTAPFAVASIEVNGIPYPVVWTDRVRFQLVVPLPERTNVLSLVGKDLRGNPVGGAADSITVTYTGTIQQAEDYVALNEIHYNPLEPRASFIELYNASTTTPFDLSGYRLDGVGYTFTEGAIIQPKSYMLVVKDRAAFGRAYGGTITVFDQFPGNLDNGGEHLALVKPGPTPAEDKVISDVRYDDRLPWPTNADGLGPSLQLIDALQDTYRVGNWSATDPSDANRVTPGRANTGRQVLDTFPALWINEVVPDNASCAVDNAQERDPWIELYNASDWLIDLSAFYLSDTYTNLALWQFPAGTTIEPKKFLVVWADGQVEQSIAGSPHTSFRLTPTNGSVALARLQGWTQSPAVMDYLDYAQLAQDRAFGCYPDGEPRKRRVLDFPTPNAANNPDMTPVEVRINEFMADNTRTLEDPSDHRYDDWFELYNAGANSADLTGYTLSDNLTNTTMFRIPPGMVIPPGGFALVWADEDTRVNAPGAELHVNFRLSATNGCIGLFSPDGALVDSVEYGRQTNDVSMGRFPDGAEGAFMVMEMPTPRDSNVLPGANNPPVLNAIGDQTVAEQTALTFTATATDPDPGQTITYSLSADAPPGAFINPETGVFEWTPTEAQGPGAYSFSVRGTDSGVPPRKATRRITVTVAEVNQPPILGAISDQVVNEGALLSLSVPVEDLDLPANPLAFSVDAGAPPGLEINPASGLITWIPSESQGPGSYTITVRVTDNGAPPLGDTRTFRLTVNEVNNPPVFDNIQAQAVDELSLFTLTARAVDPDTPPSSMRYSLDIAPDGALIDTVSGRITWTPTEAQGPVSAVFVVRATELNRDGLSSAIPFGVAVNEVNEPPVLASIPDREIREGDTLVITNVAADVDLPAQKLIYALDPGAPAEASIGPDTGVLVWAVGDDVGESTNSVTVRVTDSGLPPSSAARTFNVVVRSRPHMVINEIMYRAPVARTEYIELYNDSTNKIENLAGVQLKGSSLAFTFPPGTLLQPGAYMLLVKDIKAFAAAYTNTGVVAGEYSGDPGLTGDTLRLIRPGLTPDEDTLLDEVTYSSQLPWPAAAAGQGASLQLVDPKLDNKRIANWSAAAGLSPSQPRNLILMTNLWRYYEEGDPDAGWQLPGFNDSAWPESGALLYSESAALPAPKTTELVLGKTTYYFRTSFRYIGPMAGVSLILNTVIDDGAVFWLNGTNFFNISMSNPEPTYDLFAERVVGDAALEGPFPRPADSLRQGDNVLAVEVHQCNAGSSDIVFGMTMDIEAGNIEPFTPGYANSVRAALAPFAPVWINEVLPNNATGIADHSSDRDPWIELYNSGREPLALDGYCLTDTYTNLVKWPFPAGTVLGPGEFLLVWADGEIEERTADELHASFRLARRTGSLALVRLQNGEPAVVDYFDYNVLSADQPFGCFRDGQPDTRKILSAPTPMASNTPMTRIIAAAFTPDGHFKVTWTAQPNSKYRLEYKNSLADGDWVAVETVSALGGEASAIDQTAAGPAARFYRVVSTP